MRRFIIRCFARFLGGLLYIFELAAIAAAFCWALGGYLAAGPSQHLGAFSFTRLRMTQVLLMLAIVVCIRNTWASVIHDFWIICLSGLVGIFLGDTALFATMRRIGPRRTAVMFAANGPMGAVLGYLFLGEILQINQLLGCSIVVAGIIVAILYGRNDQNVHELEKTYGPLWLALLMGLTAALCQAAGAILVKPALQAGADPVAVSALRVAVSVIVLFALLLLPTPVFRAQNPLTGAIFWRTALSGFLAMAVGMTLVLFALKGGQVGVVTVLSSTSPILVLPILWLTTRQRPTTGAWVAAILVVIGSGLIFI